MKLALVGCCRDSRALVRAAQADRDMQVIAVFDAETARPELFELGPAAEWGGDWETLLTGGQVDAVIVAGRSAAGNRDEVLRRLAQAAIPTLVVHPACEAILAYELDMIRQDNHCPLLPYFPGIDHPAVQQARTLGQQPESSPLGTLEQLTVERTVPQRDRDHVLDCFVRDMYVVRQIVGDIGQVSALASDLGSKGPYPSGQGGSGQVKSGQDNSRPWQLSVNLTSHGGQLIRWTVNYRSEGPGAILRIEGTHGLATLTMPEDDKGWRIHVVSAATENETAAPQVPPKSATEPDSEDQSAGWNGPRTALERLRRAVQGEPAGPDWSEACRDLEIADSVAVSLRRGRTIQLHHEQHTEEGSFKGIMAVGGCSLLMLGLLLLIVFSVIEGFRMPGRTMPLPAGPPDTQAAAEPTALVWRLWPVYPFALFLLLQLLRMVFRRESARNGTPAQTGGDQPTVPSSTAKKT